MNINIPNALHNPTSHPTGRCGGVRAPGGENRTKPSRPVEALVVFCISHRECQPVDRQRQRRRSLYLNVCFVEENRYTYMYACRVQTFTGDKWVLLEYLLIPKVKPDHRRLSITGDTRRLKVCNFSVMFCCEDRAQQ